MKRIAVNIYYNQSVSICINVYFKKFLERILEKNKKNITIHQLSI